MRVVVCHYGKCVPGGLQASARIALLLTKRYDAILVDQYVGPGAAVREMSEKGLIDVCIVVSSASGFAKPEMRELVGELAARAGRFVFVQNDFMTETAGQIGTWFRKLGKVNERTVWSTIPKRLKAERAGPLSTYVNWNMLTWDPRPLPSLDVPRLFYYGAHRRERVDSFQRWLSLPDVSTVVSTSNRVFNKWRETAPHAELVPPLFDTVRDMPQLGGLTVYAEDAYSHKSYCSPANRLYEYLSAGVPFLVDEAAVGTLVEAGYKRADVMKYVCGETSPRFRSDCVHLSLSRRTELAAEQRALWGGRDYRAELEEMLCAAESKIGLAPVAAAQGVLN